VVPQVIDTITRAVAATCAQVSSETAAAFSVDPERALRDGFGLEAVAVPGLDQARDEGGACDGVSFLDDGVILYRPTGNRRQFFTLAHELGHWLVDQTDEVYDLLGRERESAKLLETVCDRIAQQLLLPESVIDSVLSDEPPSARHVAQLTRSSLASRAVCAIALAGRLSGVGAVVITDPGRTVVASSSVRPDPSEGWPTVFPWRGQPIPSGHPLERVRPASPVTQRSFWRTPWGKHAEYYVDAVADGPRAISVLSATDLWACEPIHLDSEREFDRRPLREVRCCGKVRQVRGWPCATCGEHYCPECGKCLCDRRAAVEVRCQTCGYHYLPHLVVDGVCVDCR